MRQLEADVQREVARVSREHEVVRQQGRPCRICQDPEAKRRVNLLLSTMVSIPEVVNAIADLNQGKKKKDQIGYWSVQHHRANHFNIQEPAKEAYRRMMERYRQEEGELLGEAVGNILTAKGMLEIIAQKGMEDLVAEDTKVGFMTGLDARLKLEEMMRADRDQAAISAIRQDVALIQQAIREELSEEDMRRLSRRLDILRGKVSEDDDDHVIDAEIIDDADDDGYADTAMMISDEESPE